MIARSFQVLGRRRLLQRVDADELAATSFFFKFDYAINQRKQRVVLAASDILAGFPFGAALARQNIAAEH